MGLIFTEAFDSTPANLVAMGKWNASSLGFNIGGRNLGGTAWSSSSSTSFLTKNFAAADQHDTMIVGFAVKISVNTNQDLIQLWGDAGTSQHITLRLATSGFFEIYRGPPATNLLGTSSVALALSTWYYVELKARLHDTAGTVDVRVNGVNVLSLAGQDTKNAGTETVFNLLKINAIGNSWVILDDLYVCNGAGTVNNDFLGDVRVERLIPNGAGSNNQWTPHYYNRLQSMNVAGIETDASGWVADTNCTIARVTTPVRSGAGSLQITATAAGDAIVRTPGGTDGFPVRFATNYNLSGYVRAAAATNRQIKFAMEWYDASGATISRSTFGGTSTPSTSTFTLIGSSTHTAPAYAAYAALCLQVTAAGAGEIHYADDLHVTEASSPYTGSPIWSDARDLTVNPDRDLTDVSYVRSLVDDQVDTWSHTDVPSTIPSNQAIKGVVQYVTARSDTASAKSLAMVAGEMAGGTVPAYRAGTSGSDGSGVRALTIPATVAEGDVMLLAISGIGTPVTPSGWALVRADVGTGTDGRRQSIYSRIANATDASGLVTCAVDPVAGGVVAILHAYSGATLTGLASGATGSSGDGATLTAPSIVTPGDDCRVVEFYSITGTNTTDITGPATVRNSPAAVGWSDGTSSDQEQAVAGATGTKVATASVAGSWVATILALAPPSTLVASDDLALPQSYGILQKAWELSPTDAAWTVSALNSAEFGVKLRPPP